MNKNIIHPMALAAVLLMPTLAAAQTATVNALSGDIVAKGVGVDVSVQISCTGISTPYANPTITSLTERVGKSLTNGGGQNFFEPITCDGSLQTFHVLVPVMVNVPLGFTGIRFSPGSAVAVVNAQVCDNTTFQCTGAPTQNKTIRLK
jgi:hypothetical protein